MAVVQVRQTHCKLHREQLTLVLAAVEQRVELVLMVTAAQELFLFVIQLAQ
jgi:hypothetical protein